MTGKETVRTTSAVLPRLPENTVVTAVLLSSAADRALIATQDGELFRYDIRDAANPVLAERRKIFDGPTAVTSLSYLNGEYALVVGGSDGSVDVYFRIQTHTTTTADGSVN